MKRYLSIIIVMLIMSSCLTTSDMPPKPNQLDVPKIENIISDSVNGIDKASSEGRSSAVANEVLANSIKTNAKDRTIKLHATTIAGNSAEQIKNMDTIKDYSAALSALNYQVQIFEQYAKKVEEQNNKIIKENKKAREDIAELHLMLSDISKKTDENFAKIMYGLMIVGSIGIVAGILMFAIGMYSGGGFQKTGLFISGIGLTILSAAYFMGSNPIVVMIVGGISIISIIIVLIIQIYRHQNSFDETIESLEDVKKHGWEVAKEKLKSKQSVFTKQLVAESKLRREKKGKN